LTLQWLRQEPWHDTVDLSTLSSTIAGAMLGDTRWLAWYALAKMNVRLMERLSDELERQTGLPGAWCEVLANLKAGPVRMNELADELILSRGGTTRLVARMEEAGLVARETPPSDRRATFAVITDKGRAALERSLPVHLELVEQFFGRHLEAGEAEALLRVAARVSEAHGWPAKMAG
jgi:DNA-binding MarR family transcriptional regulator